MRAALEIAALAAVSAVLLPVGLLAGLMVVCIFGAGVWACQRAKGED